jgi:hypothetical protein
VSSAALGVVGPLEKLPRLSAHPLLRLWHHVEAQSPAPRRETPAIAADVPAGPLPTIDAIRPVVIAPDYLAPVNASPGTILTARATSVGSDAAPHVPAIIEALADAGLRDGLGPDRVRFPLVNPSPRAEVIAVDPARLPSLASPPSGGPILRRLTILLNSPVFLGEREARDRRMISDPSFATFVPHSIRIIRELFPAAKLDEPEAVNTAASQMNAVADELRTFRQAKASRRTFRRFDLEGIVGSRTFADVPGAFLPWLTLAGILHVGGHRVAGAGSWTVETHPATTASATGRERFIRRSASSRASARSTPIGPGDRASRVTSWSRCEYPSWTDGWWGS